MQNEAEADTLPIEPETLDQVAEKWRTGVAVSERPTRRWRKPMQLTDRDLDLIVEAYS